MQKGLLISVVSSLAALLMPTLTAALNIGDLEFRIRPRLEGGLMYYEYEQDGFLDLREFENFGDLTISQNKLKFKDTLPVVLGGITFFIDRFFIDLNAQKAFNGSDSDSQLTSRSLTNELIGYSENIRRNTRFDTDFDRTEYAISVGYAINERIAVFAGYKRAKTEFDNIESSGTFKGNITGFTLFNVQQGSVESDENVDFEYDGPFVGVTYGLDVNKDFFKGVLSFNSAAAFLDSDFERKSKVNVRRWV